MRKVINSIIILVLLIGFTSCSNVNKTYQSNQPQTTPTVEVTPIPEDKTQSVAEVEDFSLIITIPAPSLNSEFFQTPNDQPTLVILPPSYYDDTSRNYPVIYYLHGFGGNPIEANSFEMLSKDVMGKTGIGEFIVVSVNGRNSYQGSFFVNSPVSGNWEDYVIKDVIAYVDQNYRTISSKESRGIMGFSMGGFGAINLAMRYPDVFSSVFAICPGLFDENGLEAAFRSWDSGFKTAYGVAFSPDVNNETSAQIPKFDGSEADNNIVDNWENGYGNLKGKLSDYLAKADRLKGIQIDYSSRDQYAWIADGSIYFSELLNENNIEHVIYDFKGGHVNTDSIQNRVLPFFTEHLGTD